MKERTFILLKPDAVRRGLVGRIITRIEDKGMKIGALKLLQLSQTQAEKLYEMHKDKPFYIALIRHITSGPVATMVAEGDEAVRAARSIAGATDPLDADVGTIRGDFGLTITENVIHAADSRENVLRETKIFFNPEEIIS